MRDMGVRGLLVLPTAVTRSYRLEPIWNWWPLPLLQRLLRPAGNQFDGTTLRQWHHQLGNCRRMNSMVDRDRGESRDSSPPTPPYVRVRIRRFGELGRSP